MLYNGGRWRTGSTSFPGPLLTGRRGPGNEFERLNLPEVLSFASFATFLDDPRRPRRALYIPRR